MRGLVKELGLKAGDQVVLVDEGWGHQHWGFRKGRIYTITEYSEFRGDFSGGINLGDAKCPDRNWAGWKFELVNFTLENE